ncbi:hypothetical protein GT037_002147 [Alternaria burnsii]|uniref:Uncharacterized protein n=1 Tax=Alternaria burnsii TaxID=1187904 RepID=A0A8H7B9V2_9PLEO|nr:uncharacterized protein GT037_002147 [Alternaria burnsii]KAF7680496.1 hypothetical protein GT037_002147 [Alternaria burnsii]
MMQFATHAAFLASMALTATAAPVNSIKVRQEIPHVLYRDTGCGRDGSSYGDDYDPLQNTTATGLSTCMNLPPSFSFASTYFNETGSLTRTIRFYDLPCSELTTIDSGYHIDITPGSVGCQTLTLKSYVTL